MKVGDQMVVNIGAFEVGMATIEDISDGKATILIPATRVVMGVRQELEPLNPEVDRMFAGTADSGAPITSEAIEAQTKESGTSTQVQSQNASAGSTEPATEPVVSLRDMKLDDSAVDRE